MKVYILYGSVFYEGGNILGVFSTKEKALNYVSDPKNKGEIKSYDSVDIDDYEVDGVNR